MTSFSQTHNPTSLLYHSDYGNQVYNCSCHNPYSVPIQYSFPPRTVVTDRIQVCCSWCLVILTIALRVSKFNCPNCGCHQNSWAVLTKGHFRHMFPIGQPQVPTQNMDHVCNIEESTKGP
ncbi:hypothetical protein O6P43_026177 [Quillaja saponaria]|uniref:Uncharacterized protein n=1 Tax=Quillaja saponaria TaxID=32244 RepID=A0AAD7LBC6_QUISA|nr:hypothetical protein O6P43_026177 [Quillaja saponaria]